MEVRRLERDLSFLLLWTGQLTLGQLYLATVVAFLIQGIAAGMFDVAQLTLRQLLTPDRLQARMNATMRTFFWGPRPLGFLLGGFAGSLFGLIPTFVLGGIICTLSTVCWVTPRIASLRAAPEPVEA
ncbi:MAG TPA: hypothetical protein VKG03_03205 [Solirubrobacterales bacterium]|nr:hypothetical protein [Solirubrobacterales bacterium]